MDTDVLGTTLAERLRAARRAAQQTQRQLAGDTVHPGYISAIECGRCTPSLSVLSVLAERLGIRLADLTGTLSSNQIFAAEHLSKSPSHQDAPVLVAETTIRRRLAQAEQFIRQNHAVSALRFLQAPGAPPSDWPVHWHPCWYLLVGWALLQHAQPQEARSVLEEGLALLKQLVRRPRMAKPSFLRAVNAWLRYWLGVSFHQSDQPIQALRAYQQVRSTIAAGTVRDPELKMRTCQGLGQIYRLLGSTARAITFLTLALDAGFDVCAPQTQGVITFELGLAYHEQGDLPRAKDLLTQALQQVEQLNQLLLAAQVRSYLGLVLLHFQQDKEAEQQIRQGLGMALRSGDPATQGVTLGNLAAWQLARGQPEQAIRTVQEGLAIFQQKEEPRLAGHLSLLLAQAYEVQHQLGAAERVLLSAISLLAPTQHEGLLVRAHERYGQFLAAQGRFQEAFQQLQLALGLLKIGRRRFH